jgi:hypothetical protein
VVPAAVATTIAADVVIAAAVAAIAVEDVVAAAIVVVVVAAAAVVAVVAVSPRKVRRPTTWDTVLCLPAMVVANADIVAHAAVPRIKEIQATWATQLVLRLAKSRIPITQFEARATF